MKEMIESSIRKVEDWVEEHDYKGYDPFDGLTSFLKPLTSGNLLLERLLMQLIRQSPVNIRPLLGVKPLDSTIGRGYMAWGYIAMFKRTGEKKYEDKAKACLRWLMGNKAPDSADYSWGKHFDYASRGGRYYRLEPITIWTSIIGEVFLDAYETYHDKKFLDIAVSICNWILKLPRNQLKAGICLNYTAAGLSDCRIHNQSMIAASVLAHTAKHTGSEEYLAVARQTIQFHCASQLANGGWYYGEAENQHWIDNFHTGYNLNGLKCYIENSAVTTFTENLDRGYRYFKQVFIEKNGRPKYYHNRAYPIDIQCAAQAIETLAVFSDRDKEAIALALKVAKWTIENMQDKSGYFIYRIYPYMNAKIPMIHWGQATMYRALALLLLKMKEHSA